MPIFEKPHVEHEKHLCSKVQSGITLEDYKKLVIGIVLLQLLACFLMVH